jgi:predicted homoserine dehydrogenase-like protein
MPAPIRLGLAGAGRWGRNYIRTIAGLSGVRLTRVASSNPATADLLPPDCGLADGERSRGRSSLSGDGRGTDRQRS